MNSNLQTRMWRVNKTVHQMVADRGYLVSRGELEMDLQQFQQSHASSDGTVDRQNLTFVVTHSQSADDKLLVFFADEETLGITRLRKMMDRMRESTIMKAILIFPMKLSPQANKFVNEMQQQKYYVELFSEAELLVNITQHVLVPKHEVLVDEAKKLLLKRYRLKETQLPRIQVTDPVARYYGLKRGQVVKITRPSETAGKYVTYRFCF